ncbi:glycosyltransferase family 2 protein [Furfurilactobacillus entadae]|uniref:glycosyltransferase family 2 protein n=1 Tax=Furfurilactobacillus entadae TaxID=2922307 RepID=UPI0035E60F4F
MPEAIPPLISIVMPVYNEEALIMKTLRTVQGFINQRPERYEVIFVDDGSSDTTIDKLKKASAFYPDMRLIRFSRNFGHQLAITAGIRYATGDAVVVMDADLQDPPAVIGDMINAWQRGADVVYGQRSQRDGESWFKKTSASAFYRLLHAITNVDIPVDTGDFRLMDRKVVNVLDQMNEDEPFVRGMVSWIGFNQQAVTYERQPRTDGESKYPLRKMIRLAMDGVTSFSNLPLKLATWFGTTLFIAALVDVISAIWFGFTPTIITLCALLIIGGMILTSIGFLGQYLGRIFNQSRERPLYIVAETRGFPTLAQQPASQPVSLSHQQ